MRKLSTTLAILLAAGLLVPGTTGVAAKKPTPKTKAAAKKAAPKVSQETINWGKTQTEQADKYLAAGEYEKARDIYCQVLWKLPSSTKAKEGLKKADAAITAKQNQDKYAAQNAARSGAAEAQERLKLDKKLQDEASGVSKDINTITQTIGNALVKGDFQSIPDRFDDRMKSQMTPAQIKAVYDGVVAQAGPFTRFDTMFQNKEAGYDSVYLCCVFERASYYVKAVFNTEKQVSGFWILSKDEVDKAMQQKQQEETPPAP